jgi:DNA-binding response OmpR family regulator
MARILIVTRERTLVEPLVTVLERNGHSALLATNPVGALAIAEHGHPDLAIISDNLPPNDEIHATLRNWYSPERLPIMVLTETRAMSEAATAESLRISFVPSELLEKVRALIGAHDKGPSRSV